MATLILAGTASANDPLYTHDGLSLGTYRYGTGERDCYVRAYILYDSDSLDLNRTSPPDPIPPYLAEE